ncbi:MAG: hypothetical protein ACFCVF_12155 [Kineosporiaceae bacterium]
MSLPDLGRRDPKDPNDRDRPERPRPEPHGPWLVVRYDEADHGHRPVPPGDVFWLSPDIWVTGGAGLGTIVEGVPFTAHARVWNLGAFPASPTRVDFAIHDPALGLGTPVPMGTAWIPHLPGLSTADVSCPTPWVRESLAAGHPCLVVKVSSHPFDEAPPGFNSRTDRHTGQRNLTVVSPESVAADTLTLTLAATPLIPGAQLRLAVTAALTDLTAFGAGPRLADLLGPGPAALTRTLRALETTQVPVPALRRRATRLAAAGQDPNKAVRAFDARPFVRVHGMDLTDLPVVTSRRAAAAAPVTLGEIPVPGDRKAADPVLVPIELKLPRVDGDAVVHLWQLEDGVATGGYSVLVTRTPLSDAAADRAPSDTRRGPRRSPHPAEEDHMAKDEDLDGLVLSHFPAARIARDAARQLAGLLPIRSAAELGDALRRSTLVIEGEKVDLSDAVATLPEAAFPVETLPDLVAKTVAAVRIASALAGEGRLKAPSKHLAAIAGELAAAPPTGGPGIPAGHFAGPSLFGSTKEGN